MCIVLHKPVGITLDREVYANCFDANRDGAGFAFADGGKLHVEKGFFTLEDFLKAFEPHAARDAVVHFRIGTSAKKDEFNCHPWMVRDCHQGFEFAVAHNGILQYPHSDTKSDTGHFVDEVLGAQLRRDPWFLDYEPGRFLIEQYLGAYNKMVILRSDGKVYILNRQQGVEKDGTWYSNEGFKKRACIVPAYNFFNRGSDYPSYYGKRFDPYDQDEPSFRQPDDEAAPIYDSAPKVATIPRGGISLLPHLTREERVRMRRYGVQLCGHQRISWEDMIDRVRDAFIDHHPDKANLSQAELDREIMKLSIRHADVIFS